MTGNDRQTISDTTAKMLLEVQAVHFNAEKPYIFTSGWASPVYIDCRKLISYPRVRRGLMEMAEATILRDVGYEQIDAVAGGETAGIPFAAWLSDRLMVPMQYVRKKPKGFGRNAQIEGAVDRRPARAAGRGPDHRQPQQDQLHQRAAHGGRDGEPLLRAVPLQHIPRKACRC